MTREKRAVRIPKLQSHLQSYLGTLGLRKAFLRSIDPPINCTFMVSWLLILEVLIISTKVPASSLPIGAIDTTQGKSQRS